MSSLNELLVILAGAHDARNQAIAISIVAVFILLAFIEDRNNTNKPKMNG